MIREDIADEVIKKNTRSKKPTFKRILCDIALTRKSELKPKDSASDIKIQYIANEENIVNPATNTYAIVFIS